MLVRSWLQYYFIFKFYEKQTSFEEFNNIWWHEPSFWLEDWERHDFFMWLTGIQIVSYPSQFCEVSRESNIPYTGIFPSTNIEYRPPFYQSTSNPAQPTVKHNNFVQTHY
jgi:hypothetical protein